MGSWSTAIKAGVVSVAVMAVVALGSIAIAAFQGHALATDVAASEKRAGERVGVLEDRFESHVTQSNAERIAQALFRGEVSGKLELILDALPGD